MPVSGQQQAISPRWPCPKKAKPSVLFQPVRVQVQMKGVVAILVLLLGLLQYKLWVGDGSLSEVWQLKQKINAQETENRALRQRNQQLEADVRDLKEGLDAAEERAREELGMVKRGEVFYLVVEE